MRAFAALLLPIVLAVGCASKRGDTRHRVLSYTFLPAEVLHVSAQAVNTNAVRWAVDPAYKAELHLTLNETGAQRFQDFNATHEGERFDVLVNGQLLAGLIARPYPGGPVVEMGWYVESIEQAKRFADDLSNR